MKKVLVCILFCYSLTACSSTSVDVSPRQTYRPANSNELWDISGSLHSEFDQMTGDVSRILSVHINEELAVKGNLSRMGTGELTGSYKENKVHSICASEQKTANWIDVRCTILINNERAATLTF